MTVTEVMHLVDALSRAVQMLEADDQYRAVRLETERRLSKLMENATDKELHAIIAESLLEDSADEIISDEDLDPKV